MALNQIYDTGDQFEVTAAQVTTPTGANAKVSGAPGLVGLLPVVLLTDPADNGAGTPVVTVKTNGVYEFPVAAVGSGISVGQRVYALTAPGSTLTLNNTSASSTPYGYALAPVDNGATTVIPVKIHP